MQIDKDELIRRIKAARLVDCSDPEAAVLAIVAEMQEPILDSGRREDQRQHGEWMRKNNSNSWFECSVCKEVSDVVTIMREPIWHFCPNCGARMTGEGEVE